MEQKPKKMHSFLHFMKKYPVVISLTIAIPFTAAFFSYMASDYDFHYNIEYHGEEINADAENFELTGIKKVADVMQMSTGFSYQGGACYENYYAVCCHGFESIIIYDENGEVKSQEPEYEDGSGTIVFGDDGTFTWHENQSESGDDMVFEWIPVETEPSTES